MLAGRHDLIIEQGQDWTRSIDWQTSGATAKALAGLNANFIIGPVTKYAGGAILTLTQDSGITLASTSYNIVLVITDTQTAALDFERAVYILEVEVGGLWYRIMEGYVYLIRNSLYVAP